MVKNLPSTTGHVGSIPGRGTKTCCVAQPKKLGELNSRCRLAEERISRLEESLTEFEQREKKKRNRTLQKSGVPLNVLTYT